MYPSPTRTPRHARDQLVAARNARAHAGERRARHGAGKRGRRSAEASQTGKEACRQEACREGMGGLGLRAVQIANQLTGIPYRWGGASPGSGFDCSGLVQFVYGKVDTAFPIMPPASRAGHRRRASAEPRCGPGISSSSPASATSASTPAAGSSSTHPGAARLSAGRGSRRTGAITAPRASSQPSTRAIQPAARLNGRPTGADRMGVSRRDDLEPRTAPEPMTAEEWTRSRAARVAVPVAGGAIAAIVKLVGVHALLRPGVIGVAIAIAVFVTGLFIVTRRSSARD